MSRPGNQNKDSDKDQKTSSISNLLESGKFVIEQLLKHYEIDDQFSIKCEERNVFIIPHEKAVNLGNDKNSFQAFRW